MVRHSENRERINVTLTQEALFALTRAARLMGVSRSHFIVESALQRAMSCTMVPTGDRQRAAVALRDYEGE